jgi:addiction module RelE/StbE family toxin
MRRNPQLSKSVKETLELLESDVFHPHLRTHKLKGNLKDCWSCSVVYDVRIVFEIIKEENEDAILLLTIGTHDEVY